MLLNLAQGFEIVTPSIFFLIEFWHKTIQQPDIQSEVMQAIMIKTCLSIYSTYKKLIWYNHGIPWEKFTFNS